MKSGSESPASLRELVFDRIERENVCPRSRLFFQSRECVVWSLWLLTVLVGALAIAVSLFVVTHRRYALYEATHDNFLTFFATVLPTVWVVIFLLMIGFAIYNVRHTRRGYRRPLWMIAASSVVLSFAGGSLLQMLGLGAVIDREFGDLMATYPSQERMERALWQAPAEGRLVGRMEGPVGVATGTIWFTDVTGQRWQVTITDFYPADHEVLSTRERVRLLGVPTTKPAATERTFHACGAFPWLYEEGRVDTQRLQTARQEFVQRIYARKEDARERLAALVEVRTTNGVVTSAPEEEVGTPPEQLSPCARLPVLNRVHVRMDPEP